MEIGLLISRKLPAAACTAQCQSRAQSVGTCSKCGERWQPTVAAAAAAVVMQGLPGLHWHLARIRSFVLRRLLRGAVAVFRAKQHNNNALARACGNWAQARSLACSSNILLLVLPFLFVFVSLPFRLFPRWNRLRGSLSKNPFSRRRVPANSVLSSGRRAHADALYCRQLFIMFASKLTNAGEKNGQTKQSLVCGGDSVAEFAGHTATVCLLVPLCCYGGGQKFGCKHFSETEGERRKTRTELLF